MNGVGLFALFCLFALTMGVACAEDQRPPLQSAVGPVSLEAGTQIAVRLNEAVDGNTVWLAAITG